MDFPSFLAAAGALALVLALTLPRANRPEARETRVVDGFSRESPVSNDMNDDFIEAIDRPRPVVDLVRVYSVADEGLLRAMLDSASIPSFSNNSHFQSTQFGPLIASNRGIVISVFEKDHADASAVLADFLEGRRRVESEGVAKGHTSLLKGLKESAGFKAMPPVPMDGESRDEDA